MEFKIINIPNRKKLNLSEFHVVHVKDFQKAQGIFRFVQYCRKLAWNYGKIVNPFTKLLGKKVSFIHVKQEETQQAFETLQLAIGNLALFTNHNMQHNIWGGLLERNKEGYPAVYSRM